MKPPDRGHAAPPNDLTLHEVTTDDLPIFFRHQVDAEANFMAAFTVSDPQDWEAFVSRWDKWLPDETIMARTIRVEGNVVGHVSSYEEEGRPEITYWIGKEHWGRGYASLALREFLDRVNLVRPIYARCAKDNPGSLRVLAKCGFTIAGEDKGFANARGAEVEEYILVLKT